MDILQSLVEIIQNVGFPIACVIALFYFWNKDREKHSEESNKWIEAINNNTNVMEKVLEKLKEGE